MWLHIFAEWFAREVGFNALFAVSEIVLLKVKGVLQLVLDSIRPVKTQL
jgi:hypothetical protein